ncbi:MAG: hypothetical protein OJF48_001147 [Afipia sp.]|nr:MAG: hypothetical protein OJF48_001147 [Afipia sp.]
MRVPWTISPESGHPESMIERSETLSATPLRRARMQKT